MAKHTNYNKPKKDDEVEKVSNVEETTLEPEVIHAFVDNCEKLNVRSKPFMDAEVLAIIDKNETLSFINRAGISTLTELPSIAFAGAT